MKILIGQTSTAVNHIYKYVNEELVADELKLGLYNNYLVELLFEECDADLIVIIESSIQLLKNGTNFKVEVENYLQNIREILKKNKNKQFIIGNLESVSLDNSLNEQIARFNHELAQIVREHGNSLILDISRIKNELGIYECEDFNLTNQVAYNGSLKMQMQIATKLSSTIKHMNYQNKKLLVSDLDNTFWQGIVGDEGFENMNMKDISTKLYHNFISDLQAKGIFTACVSKNSPTLLKDPKLSELLDTYFIEKELSWQPKSEAIKTLAKRFNIGLDSIVFIDDNPSEIDEVNKNCPGVTTLEYKKDISFIKRLNDSNYFLIPKNTKTDLNRIENYKQLRNKLEKSTYQDFTSYIKSLNPQIYLRDLDEENIERAIQLLNKTNQFNNYKRTYTKEVFANFAANVTIKVIDYEDRLMSEQGVSVVIYEQMEDTAYIHQWVMSCRVFKKTIEDQVLDYFNQVKLKPVLEFKPNAKNHVMQELLTDKIEFKLVDEDNEK